MKKASVLLVMIATLLFNSFAQVTTKGGTDNPSTSQTEKDKSDRNDKVKDNVSGDAAAMAREWTNKMDEIVKLDAAQEKKIMEVNLRYANKLEDLKAKYRSMDNPNAEAAKAEKDEITTQRFKDYADILSKDQMAKFKAYRNSHKDDDKDGVSNKDKAKDKYENASPEEKERMKEEIKEKKENKNN